METIIKWIIANAEHAHWMIFGSILLAGLNIPISIDLLIIISAVLAATTVPSHAPLLFLSVFIGACLSAWISYWIGRKLGEKLSTTKWFKALMPQARVEKLRFFYEKHGFWTLLIGRFIPFGVRNCLFMTTGMSKMHFGKFVLRDTIACMIWSSVCFYLVYTIGQNYEVLYNNFKLFSLILVAALAVIIGSVILWKKKSSKAKT